MNNNRLLTIENLSVHFPGKHEDQSLKAVDQISFSVAAGETLALVGESGSGKTMAALSVLGLLPPSAEMASGRIQFDGLNMHGMDEEAHRKLRGNRIAMVFQEPMTALNPVYKVSRQLMEPIILHREMNKIQARKEALELLHLTGIPEPQRAIDSYVHQLSGGQRQRVMIAMALACRPSLLIADEPTTALDVTIQAQILTLLRKLRQELNMAMLLITHDLPMVRSTADRVCVMRHGKILETAPTDTLFSDPQHPYSRELLESLPPEEPPPDVVGATTLLSAHEIRCHFPIKKGFFRRTKEWVKAVDSVTLALKRGQTVGVVGESGSGKTTLGEAILRLNESTGQILFDGEDLRQSSREALRTARRRMQLVFQDPFSSLSPRLTIGQIIEEGLQVHRLAKTPEERRAKVVKALQEVGLDETVINRYPHQFSGGQRQRIAIARSMVLEPELLVLDEPTSALDLSVQAQILDLLLTLQRRHQLAYLFISHDLRVVRALSHEVLVMLNGKVVEHGPTRQVFQNPQHPYTRTLLSAALGLGDRSTTVIHTNS
ncbi:MAG: ABC transporter ATP-binding protein [Magnetococcales bacterium]|nr:ABC transporter ATP-binding protein [Magnetococcales bacterium]